MLEAATPPASEDRTRGPTIAEARRTWTAKFRGSGMTTPELDARLLIGHALGLDHAALAAAATRRLNPTDERAIEALTRRRLGHEPVARIVGTKEFWSLMLRVDGSTLVPRPETETVVEAALAAIDARGGRDRPLRLVDLGTGSGAILLALLTELPNAFGIGTDASPRALAVARDNARSLGLRRAAFVACDMAAALLGPFDIVVSNPPYVATNEIDGLPPEVRLFDPRLALDGGSDGLNGYRAIAANAPKLLAPDSVIAVELGAGQAKAVAGLFAREGLAAELPRSDLSGVARAIVARKIV